MRPRGHPARPLLLDRRRDLRRARGRPPGDREPPDQPDLALRLREALDREVHALLPRGPRLPDPGLPLRQRLRALAGRHGRGRRRRDLLGGHARRAAARRSTATASRRATTSTSATSSGRPPRAADERQERRLEPRHGSRDFGQPALFALLAKEYGYTATPPHVPAPAGEQMRSVLDGSLVRRDFGLPEWTPLEDGLKETAEFFRSRATA